MQDEALETEDVIVDDGADAAGSEVEPGDGSGSGSGGSDDAAAAAGEAGGENSDQPPAFDISTLLDDHDGVSVFNLSKLIPEDMRETVRIGYGDTDKDWFTWQEADRRRQEVDRAVSEASQWKQDRHIHFTQDGTPKGQILDDFNERLNTDAAGLLLELAEGVTDPVALSWEILAKYGGPAAQALAEGYQQLSPDAYNPHQLQAQQAQKRIEQLEQQHQEQQQQQQLEAARSQAQQQANILAGRVLDNAEFEAIEKIWGREVTLWQHGHLEGQVGPQTGDRPTLQDAYKLFVEKQGSPPTPAAPPEQKDKPKPPVRGGKGSGGEKRETGLDVAKELINKRNAGLRAA